MDYHLRIFDYRHPVSWVYNKGNRVELSKRNPGDMKQSIRKRVKIDAPFLNEAVEIRRNILRFDESKGVVVYLVRLSHEPNEDTEREWKNTLGKARFLVCFEPGHLVGLDPWAEYVATPEERNNIISLFAKWHVVLKWPISDAISLSVIQGVPVPSSSTSGPVTAGAGTTPQPPVGHGASSPGPMAIDSPPEDVEMESPVPPPFSPTTIPRSLEPPSSVVPSAGDLTGAATSTPYDGNLADDTLSTLNRSKLFNRHTHVSMPVVDQGALISEASVFLLDPTSEVEVQSVQLQSRDNLATNGMVTLRPRTRIEGLIVDGHDATAGATHYALAALDRVKDRYLGHRGYILGAGKDVPPCTFTQSVTPHPASPSIFDILYDCPDLSLDANGVDLSVFWKFLSGLPPLTRIRDSQWPPSLSTGAIKALSEFPERFHGGLHPPPIHGTDIAGDGLGRSVFKVLVPRPNAWNSLPYQLPGLLNDLAKQAEFDAYNDPDASLVPLVQVGRLFLVHGMVQPTAGIPLAQYHVAGSRRIWIAVPNRHRNRLSESLPGKSPFIHVTICSSLSDNIRACFWRHGDVFIRPDFLRDNRIPFTICIQDPGDVVLIGGSTLYESYDEGPNVILSIPYLDQNAYDTIKAHQLVSLDSCSCPAERRNNVVDKRNRVLQAGLAIDAASDAIDALFDSNSPLTDVMEIEEPLVEASLSRSPMPIGPSVAMDGPCAEKVGLSMEPVGEIVLEDYEQRGVIIVNLRELQSIRPEDLVGVLPIVSVDMKSESDVTMTRLATQRLTEEYGGVLFRQHPPLPDEWSEGRSMDTLRQQLATVSPEEKQTLGRLDARNGTTTPIQPNIYHTSFHPLGSHQVSWKQGRSTSFDWDGLYALKRFQGFKVLENDPSTPFEQSWDFDAAPSVGPPSVFSEDVLSRLPDITRSHLESLPRDLSSWNRLRSPPYCAGIGANKDEVHVLELTDHPLKDALAYLPQALMMLALYDGSQGYDAEDLDFSTFKTIQSVVSEAASGTLFPWGYGGHYRTFFGIHFEDAWMPSANLHVAGAPKIWLFIRKDDFRRLYTILSPVLSPCFTFHRSLFIHPRFLIRNGIRFTVARQTTGDMIVAGSTSAHLGWNVGPNLAVAANFLDDFSIDIIRREVMIDKEAPWPCACGDKRVPEKARGSGRFMDLPLHKFLDDSADDVGSVIFGWIHRARRYIRENRTFLDADPGIFARAWRYLHELNGDNVMIP